MILNKQETGVELMTLTKRFLGGNPVLFLFCFICMFCVLHNVGMIDENVLKLWKS